MPDATPPLLLWMDSPGSAAQAVQATGYLMLFGVTVMWIAERVCYFSMIQHLGSVSTVQAVYVATPAAVLFGFLLFGETVDRWLLAGLMLLMASLWLNNRAVTGSAHQTDHQSLQ